ncbi:enoyl-CoA hydratase/isomerase family protein [Inhella gelatinilytica]|uniref:Enoyl-CoA hydratase/isomerase family protein n=1 Tax=Inhella gelatinilytica TaxID=2795030 RepID=A0A931NG59_9BURK|nr:enoyl-CoA hydratase/isomerase family protein [Inhella gelatinilytica]MBH9554256.1 enoyl-CoA hydratase/isomerase family protein [Inhella gelatinilytica]
MTTSLIPPLCSDGHVLAEVNGALGIIILNRPQALNALSLPMIRDLRTLLAAWRDDARIEAVVVLGQGREGKPPAFCAGGDIRFFHTAAHAKDSALGDFFTEEYALNHEIHVYPKPYIALMDGIVMGGGMGITQGAKLRVVNERSKLAMPEAHIGLFPDVGGGWFLAQCPGHVGEWLALSGQVLGAGDAIAWGLGDVYVPAAEWDALVEALRHGEQPSAERVVATVMDRAAVAPAAVHGAHRAEIDRHFGVGDMNQVLASLQADGSEWAHKTLKQLSHNSPLGMAISLELVRRGRSLSLADDLRLERTLVHWCFEPAWRGVHCETVEGIRALAVDKDHHPRWQPATQTEVTAAQVAAMFESPWPADQHPLAHLQDA